MKLKLMNISDVSMYIDDVKQLYINAFPVEECREWNDILDMVHHKHEFFNMFVIIYDGCFAGFISWWDFVSFRYIEHFAVDEKLRGEGVGGCSISTFCKLRLSPVVLEVELPSLGCDAGRRIEFYQRNGFVAHFDYKYEQPPYSVNMPEIPMILMTWHADGENKSIDEIAKEIHRYVYKKG